MPHQDYSHRDVLDKLGIKPGHAVAFVEAAGSIEVTLRERVLKRTARPSAAPGEAANIVLASANSIVEIAALLAECKDSIVPNGGIWLLTPKRGLPGYIDQRKLIEAGPLAGLVDNKSCSVSDTTSGLRFVIRRADRQG
jgi:hypothetical protein